ncbi:hypothetical protein FQN57_003601 [Myotisia sp. PD_48]|nr:hypothetical protein FQN57_003601 [Myotisia sp. PD_48]
MPTHMSYTPSYYNDEHRRIAAASLAAGSSSTYTSPTDPSPHAPPLLPATPGQGSSFSSTSSPMNIPMGREIQQHNREYSDHYYQLDFDEKEAGKKIQTQQINRTSGSRHSNHFIAPSNPAIELGPGVLLNLHDGTPVATCATSTIIPGGRRQDDEQDWRYVKHSHPESGPNPNPNLNPNSPSNSNIHPNSHSNSHSNSNSHSHSHSHSNSNSNRTREPASIAYSNHDIEENNPPDGDDDDGDDSKNPSSHENAFFILLRISFLVPPFSIFAALYTLFTVLFLILAQPLRICPPSEFFKPPASLTSQIRDTLWPLLYTHKKLITTPLPPSQVRRNRHPYRQHIQHSSSSSFSSSHTNNNINTHDAPPSPLPPLTSPTILPAASSYKSSQYSAIMLVVIHLMSPLLIFPILFAAWVSAFFWIFAMIVGNPDGSERTDDGRAAVLGVRNWWRTWLSKARKRRRPARRDQRT